MKPLNLKIFNLVVIAFFSTLISSCNVQAPLDFGRLSYPNVLNIKNSPSSSGEDTLGFFADEGAWFGFALPKDTSKKKYDGFKGPFLIAERKWLASNLFDLKIYDERTLEELCLSESRYLENNFYPGILSRKQVVKKLVVTQSLIFSSPKRIILRADFLNLANSVKNLKISFAGKLLDSAYSISVVNNRLVISKYSDDYIYTIDLPPEYFYSIKIGRVAKSYELNIENDFPLPHGKSFSVYLFFSETRKENVGKFPFVTKPPEEFKLNEARWNGYLKKAFSLNPKRMRAKKLKILTVKSLITLFDNWRGERGALHHDGIFPSSSEPCFNGFWAWDSWKHAAALAFIDPHLAENQILAMFDYQTKDGMIPDVIYADSSENNLRNTKPPLAVWAAYKVFQENSDTNFIRKIYPKLVRYHYWFFKHRDVNKNVLCEYGSNDGTALAAKWESGMDNAVCFDSIKMLKSGEHSFSMDQESPDLNSYLYFEKILLAKLSKVLSKKKEELKFKKEAKALREKIDKEFFDTRDGYFHDRKLSGGFVQAKGPEGWIPLWTKTATQTQAKRVVEILKDTAYFNTYVPFPSVAKNNGNFSLNYWRGPVWLDQAYFAVQGLRNYGFNNEADYFTEKILNNAKGLCVKGVPLRENYSPLTGDGLNAKNFSWSASSLLLLMWGK